MSTREIYERAYRNRRAVKSGRMHISEFYRGFGLTNKAVSSALLSFVLRNRSDLIGTVYRQEMNARIGVE